VRILMPFRALVRRELVTNMRRPWLFPCIGGVTLLCILIAILLLPMMNIYETVLEGRLNLQVQRLLARFLIVVFVGSALLIPGMAAVSIAGERERETLGMLYATCAGPLSIVTAKLVNSIGVFVLVLIATMPIFHAVLIMGGGTQVVQALGLIVLMMATLGAIGLFCGAAFRSTAAALAASYAVAAAILGGPLFLNTVVTPSLMTRRRPSFGRLSELVSVPTLSPSVAEKALASVCPFSVLKAVAVGEVQTGRLFYALGYQLVFGVLAFACAWWLLRRHPGARVVRQKPVIDDAAVLEARRKKFPYYLIDPMKRKEPAPDGGNPLLFKELHGGFPMRAPVLVRLFCLVFACGFTLAFIIFYLPARTVIITSESGMFGDTACPLVYWLLLMQILTLLVSPALMVNAFTREYELESMDMLRMTLLTPWAIVSGKLFAAAIMVSPVLLGALFCAVPVLIYHEAALEQWDLLVTGYVTLSVSVFVVFAVTLVTALITRRTTKALIMSYLFNGLVFIAPLLTIPMAAAIPGVQNPSRASLFFSPIAAFMERARLRMSSSALVGFPHWFASTSLFVFFGIALIFFALFWFRRFGMQDR